MKKVIYILILIFLSGCINQNGITNRYYNDCHTEYDLYGNYKTVCPYNIYNLKKDEKKDCLQCN